MKKQTTLLEAIAMGGNVYDLLGVDRETKMLKRTTNNLAVKIDTVEEEVEYEVEEVTQVKIIEYIPITKPSDRFDIEDYIRYQEYMIKHGGNPSVEDYFKAVEYYKSRA